MPLLIKAPPHPSDFVFSPPSQPLPDFYPLALQPDRERGIPFKR